MLPHSALRYCADSHTSSSTGVLLSPDDLDAALPRLSARATQIRTARRPKPKRGDPEREMISRYHAAPEVFYFSPQKKLA
jgi:hypothetical protein